MEGDLPRRRTFFVAGATGKQGGALARQLLACGHGVRAFTRRPGGAAARLLQRLGAQVHAGGFDDRRQLVHALSGCDGAFAVTTFVEAGLEAELRHASSLLDAARQARVPHLVWTSMAGADRPSGVPHLEAKGEIERRVARAGVPYTIVAPVFLMENWLSVLPHAVGHGALAYPLPAGRALQQVAVDDVASFARMVLEHPGAFEHRRVELAGDAPTMEQVAAALAVATGCALEYRAVPLQAAYARSGLLGRLCAWLDREGTHVDVDRLRARYRDLGWTRLDAWARRQAWAELLAPQLEEQSDLRAWVAGAR